MFKENYIKLIYGAADPRIRDKFLMGNTVPMHLITAIYFVMIVFCLKPIMRDRKALKINLLLQTFNVFLFTTSCFYFYKFGVLWFTKYNWRCEPLDKSYSREALEVEPFDSW